MKKIMLMIALMLFAASYAAAYCKKCTDTSSWYMTDPPTGTGPDYQYDGWAVDAHYCQTNSPAYTYCAVNATCSSAPGSDPNGNGTQACYRRSPAPESLQACYCWTGVSCTHIGGCT